MIRALTYFDDAERDSVLPRGLTNDHWTRIRDYFQLTIPRSKTTIRPMRGWHLAFSLGAMVVSGCFTHDLRDARYAVGERHQEWTNHFFWGLVGHETVDVDKWCGGKEVAGFGSGSNGGTWFVSLITLGIYSPQTVWVDCAAGPAQTSHRGLGAKL